MCGFSFLSSPRSSIRVNFQLSEKLLKTRGPDQQAQRLVNDAYMYHARLVIQGGDDGKQPFSDNEQRYWLLFNGEIYNKVTLWSMLGEDAPEAKFRTCSDTALLFNILKRERYDILKKINGIYSFVFYDQATNKVFAMRDYLGIKPLYYHIGSSGIGLSSSVRLLGKVFNLQSNELARCSFLLANSYPHPETPFNQCFRLDPGQLFCLSLADREISLVMSIDSPFEDLVYSYDLEKDEADQTREIVQTAVRAEIFNDGKEALPLSGGLDSGIILDCLTDYDDLILLSGALPTTVDHVVAVERAKSSGRHLECVDSHSRAESAIWHRQATELPSMDGRNVLAISALAKKNGRSVIISGLGPDEFLHGYALTSVGLRTWLDRSKNIFSRISKPFCEWKNASSYVYVRGFRRLDLLQARYDISSSEIRKSMEQLEQSLAFSETHCGTNSISAFYLFNQLIPDADQYSSYFGIEARVPFLNLSVIKHFKKLEIKYGFLGLNKRALRHSFPNVSKNTPLFKRGFSIGEVVGANEGGKKKPELNSDRKMAVLRDYFD